ncbi:hypothetical protein EV2_008420 [Malus domestica]
MEITDLENRRWWDSQNRRPRQTNVRLTTQGSATPTSTTGGGGTAKTCGPDIAESGASTNRSIAVHPQRWGFPNTGK